MMKKFAPIVLASLLSLTALGASYFQKTGLVVQPTVTTTSGGTLSLAATSNQVHVFTGSSTHTLQLPDATLLYSGWFFELSNDSSATVTVAQSDLSQLFLLATNTWAKVWLTSNASATGNWKYKTSGSTSGGSGTGDVVGPAASVDSEVAIYDGTTGKLLKRASATGIAKVTSGVLSAVTAPTGDIVGHTDTQTLTNKTIDADANTITNIENADIKAGAAIDRSKLAAGTGPRIVFNDLTTGLFSEDGDFVYLATSNRVGVGTATPDGPLDVIEQASNDAVFLTLPNATPSTASLSNKQWTVSLDDTNDSFEFKAKDGLGNVISRSLGATVSTSPGGADTNVQFNDGGVFGGESTFTYDKTNNRLSSEEITSSGGGSGTTSERFGTGVDGSGNNQVVVGASADCSSGADSVCIGKSVAANTGQRSIYIGSGSAGDTVGFNTFVGYGTSGSNASTAVGNAAVCHDDSVCIGSGATANDTTTGKNIAIGKNATISSGATNNLAIGNDSAIATGSNQAVFGSSGTPYNNFYFGEGITTAGPSATTLQASGASGTDVASADFNIAGGKGTGNATPGKLVLQVATPNSASGTTLQSLVEKLRIGRNVELPHEVIKPAAPSAGYTSIYAKIDGNIYQQNSSGTETSLAGGGSGTPGGSDTQIQYNDAGAFGGDSGLVYFATSNRVGIGTTTPDGPLDVIESASNDAVYLTLPNATPNSATLAVKQWSVTLDDTNDSFEFIAKDGAGNIIKRSLGASNGGGASDDWGMVYQANGFGGTNTKVMNFDQTDSNGASVTPANSASNGGSLTLNDSGIYTINFVSELNTSGKSMVISVDDTAMTIGTSPYPAGTDAIGHVTASVKSLISVTRYFTAGAVIRCGWNEAGLTLQNGSQHYCFAIKEAGSGGSGDVSGPGSAVTDNTIARWNGTTGTAIQGSGVVVSDTNSVTNIDQVGANTGFFFSTTNQLVLGTTNTTTLNAVAPAASRVVSFPDPGANVDVLYNSTAQTVTSKTIDADSNTITNIENADIKAGAAIDRSKIAAGTEKRIVFNALTTGAMSEDADLVYLATSNRVGVGTTSPDGPLDVIEQASNDAVYLTLPNATPNSASLANKQWTVSLDDTNDTFEFKAKDGLGNVISRSLGATGSGSPGGSNTQIQYNNAGSFGAESDLVYFATSNRVGIGTSTPDGPLDVIETASNDAVYLTLPNATPNSASLANKQWTVSLDDTNDTFEFKGKDGSGNVISQTLGSTGVTIIKPADESRTSDVTLSNDAHFVFALEANKTYRIEGGLWWFSTNVTPDAKMAFTIPASATMKIGIQHMLAAGATLGELIETSGVASGLLAIGGSVASVTHVRGIVRTGATAGDIRLQWAQNASNVNAVTLLKDSYLIVTKVP